jgi:hypothetical protein
MHEMEMLISSIPINEGPQRQSLSLAQALIRHSRGEKIATRSIVGATEDYCLENDVHESE